MLDCFFYTCYNFKKPKEKGFMVQHNHTVILYSGGDIELHSGMRDLCSSMGYNLNFAFSFAELIFKQTNTHASYILVDENIANARNDMIDFIKFAEPPKPLVMIISKELSSLQRLCKNLFIVHPCAIRELMQNFTENAPTSTLIKLSSACLNAYLKRLGFNSKYIGYNYLRSALSLIRENSSAVTSLASYIYPQIALIYKTQPSNVERNIRTLIQRASKNERFIQTFTRHSNRAVITSLINQLEGIKDETAN